MVLTQQAIKLWETADMVSQHKEWGWDNMPARKRFHFLSFRQAMVCTYLEEKNKTQGKSVNRLALFINVLAVEKERRRRRWEFYIQSGFKWSLGLTYCFKDEVLRVWEHLGSRWLPRMLRIIRQQREFISRKNWAIDPETFALSPAHCSPVFLPGLQGCIPGWMENILCTCSFHSPSLWRWQRSFGGLQRNPNP